MPNNNALHEAAKAGNLAKVQAQGKNFDINAKGENDETALFKAAESGHTEVVKLLLSLDADVNIPDVSTLLMISVACNMFISSCIALLSRIVHVPS